MLKRLWLLFTQVITVLLAVWFIVATLKPSWLSGVQISSLVDQVSIKRSRVRWALY